VVIAAAGPPIRELAGEIPSDLQLPEGFRNPRLVIAGVVAVEGPGMRPSERENGSVGAWESRQPDNPKSKIQNPKSDAPDIEALCAMLPRESSLPLVVVVDDSNFASWSLNNFLWVTFTRANPAADIYGVGSFTERKHWGCVGPLVIDARIKPHHAPPLVEDPAVSKKIDALAARGGPLAKWL
jgi:4-hydroxy-3-polyprenylbenzoate decarboxylase